MLKILGSSRTWLLCRLPLPVSRNLVKRNFVRALISDDNIVSCTEKINIPPFDVNLYDFVTENFDSFGDKPALVDEVTGQVISYSVLGRQLKSFGSSLIKHGFGKGDKLAVLSPNCAEYVYTICSPGAIGGITTTLNPVSKPNEVITQLESSGASVLFASTNNALLAQECAKAVGIKKVIINDMHKPVEADNVIKLSDMLSDAGDAFPKTALPIDKGHNVVLLPYSSGTTGLPKGVMLTHHGIVTNIEQRAVFMPKKHVTLGNLPFYHLYGLSISLYESLRFGHTVIIQDGFKPEKFLSAIQTHKIDSLNLVPPLIVFLLKHPLVEQYDISSVETVTIGAAPCGFDMYHQFLEKFPHIKHPFQGYGLTETSPVAALQTYGNVKFGSSGLPLPNTEIKVVDLDTSESLKVNQSGEICVRGPQIMKGYLNNEMATSDAIREGNWLHTGDIGFYDEDGHIFVVDRLKELIKYKGLQVAPAELEDLLVAHPLIMDACVIGIADDSCGELPKAFIVKSPDSKLTEDDVKTYVEERVSPHKRLRGGVAFIDIIPKSPAGKILRRVLKDS